MGSREKDNPIVGSTPACMGACIILGVTISIGAPLLEESGMISGHTVTGVATIVIGSEDSAGVVAAPLSPLMSAVHLRPRVHPFDVGLKSMGSYFS